MEVHKPFTTDYTRFEKRGRIFTYTGRYKRHIQTFSDKKAFNCLYLAVEITFFAVYAKTESWLGIISTGTSGW